MEVIISGGLINNNLVENGIQVGFWIEPVGISEFISILIAGVVNKK